MSSIVATGGVIIEVTGARGPGLLPADMATLDAKVAEAAGSAGNASDSADTAGTAADAAAESAASILSARLGAGRIDHSARIAIALGTGATVVKRDTQEQSIGFSIAAANVGATSSIEVGFHPDKAFVTQFAGCEIELELAAKVTTGSPADRTLSAHSVYTSYDNGSADAFTGSIVSSAVDTADATVWRRRVKTTLTAAMSYLSVNYRVQSGATTAFAAQLHSATVRCVSVPAGSVYTAADVGLALSKMLTDPAPSIGSIYGSLVWTQTRNGGALARYLNGVARGVTIPVGSSGANTNTLAGFALPASWRAEIQGAALGYYFLVDHSPTFDRNLSLAVNVNPGPVAVGSDNGRFIQLSPTRRLYEFRTQAPGRVLAGTETSLSPYMRLASVQPGNVSGSDQYFEIVDAWLAIERTTRAFDRAEHARRIAALRQKSNFLSPALIIPPDTTVVTIKPSGGDFTHPKLALDVITDGRADRRYKLEIWPAEYTGYAEWHTKDWVNLVGLGTPEECILSYANPDSASEATIQNTSLFWLDSHSDVIGLTLRITNGRYVVHRETNSTRPGIRSRMIDCFVEHLGNPSPNNTWRSQFGVGAGNSPGEIYDDYNCVFRGPDGGFSYHQPNGGDYTDPTFASFDSCIFEATGVHWASGVKQPDFWIKPGRRGAGDQCVIRNSTLEYLMYFDGEWNPADTTTPRNSIAVTLSGNTPLTFRNFIASPIPGHDYAPLVTGFGGAVTWTKSQPA